MDRRSALAQCLAASYPTASRIVEVGIGSAVATALELRDLLPYTKLVVTDRDPTRLQAARDAGLEARVDDVTQPSPDVFAGTDLVYAVFPNPELVPALAHAAQEAGADVVVLALDEESSQFDSSQWIRVYHDGRFIAWARSQLLCEEAPTDPTPLHVAELIVEAPTRRPPA